MRMREVNFRKTSSGFKDALDFKWNGSGGRIFASGFQKTLRKKSSTISCSEVLEFRQQSRGSNPKPKTFSFAESLRSAISLDAVICEDTNQVSRNWLLRTEINFFAIELRARPADQMAGENNSGMRLKRIRNKNNFKHSSVSFTV